MLTMTTILNTIWLGMYCITSLSLAFTADRLYRAVMATRKRKKHRHE